ncbi:SusC/RagA family TonB-linked outer membrane protein [Mucilaginibacter galii]|uniref:SusC/RagA family TonB-linked outer membrane protein n=2 Tax=Mucilaginibacter galii TaxID=2005073 RepID=UPI001E3A4A91|nr:SusC/RagA family TonB-linked outer membrane protein [Mucilaginibacter galii]
MKKLLPIFLFLLYIGLTHVEAQSQTITGKVTAADDGLPLPGVTVKIKGAAGGTQTSIDGGYRITASPNQVITFSFVGYLTQDQTVGTSAVINVQLSTDAKSLNEVVVTALGRTTQKRSLGTSQQTVKGADIAGTQRENFINSLQGRVAGVEVNSSSGVPGASTSITIRGVSSISGSNSPLFVVDGLPIDNKTLNTTALVSDNSATTAFSNRGVDFTNRASDINPEDIESLVVLKGPEASALYGIDAANGAIVITTKRGKPGEGRIDYSNSFRLEKLRTKPEIQNTFGLGTNGVGNTISSLSGAYEYFGPQYPADTKFYDNVGNFFQTGFTQKHNLALSGGSDKATYRISTSYTNQNGVVPGSLYDRINVTGATQATLNKWMKADLSMNYEYANNDQPLKGNIGPLIGLLDWPQTDDAQNFLTPSGTRRYLALAPGLVATEVDNPYFSINKNINNTKNNRIFSNLALIITPVKWLSLKTNVGIDAYSNHLVLVRHPESRAGYSRGGTIDVANDNTRNFNLQNILSLTTQKLAKDLSISGFVGYSMQDLKSTIDAGFGENFYDPNFVSLNNTLSTSRGNKTTITQRRLASFFSQASLNYKDYLYITGTLRNDRTSTIPIERYSFYYPGVSGSFVFTDAVPALKKFFTSGKLRAAYAAVGKDARPYAYESSLESKTTVGGGYGYGLTGPNPNLRPEFAKAFELGTELSFLNDRLGLDLTVYRKTTTDQIVNDIRGSYATGFVLFNLNGAATLSKGLEITLRGDPIKSENFNWNILANFAANRTIVKSLPNGIPESYVSDANLYANIRTGNIVGNSTRGITGQFYLRNNNGQLLINPGTGLPVRSTLYTNNGYDRNPKFSIGLTNTFSYKAWSLNFLLDIRKGGDVLNATQHFLTTVGLSTLTEDRLQSRIIGGVLQDGKENSANPTVNNIAVTPYYQNGYYTNMSEELFIEKNINWIRLRDVTLNYALPTRLIKRQKFVKTASVFVTATDLFLITNYTGLDPVVNGNTAAVGGSGAVGIDYGNFPIPLGLNFGIRVSL